MTLFFSIHSSKENAVLNITHVTSVVDFSVSEIKDGSDQENDHDYFVFEASKTHGEQSVTASERAPRCCGYKMLSS